MQEYWIVDPDRELVTVYVLDDGVYAAGIEATGDMVVTSRALTGFAEPARTLFP